MARLAAAVASQLEDEWLLRALVSRKLIDDAVAQSIRQTGIGYASTHILSRNILSREQLADGIREQYGVAFADPDPAALDKMALSLIPEALCRKRKMIPFRVAGESLDLLMSNPIDMTALDDAASVSGRKPVPIYALPEKIDALLMEAYSSDAAVFELLKNLPEEVPVQCLSDAPEADKPDLTAMQGSAPVIRLANALMAQAIRMGASDIHIEHEESVTIVRYRIDGDLRNIMKLPKHIGEGPLVSRIKIMANLDVADRRRPQDGRAKLLVARQEVGLRVSTIPTAFGEKAVLRILDSRQAQLPLETLGFRPEILERMTKLSKLDKGLLLMTGPTGSGKTTTLYSILNRLKSADINVVTVEDPIEYRIAGINQVQVNEKAGLTFATVLRSVLRQDPDVVLVGEIRDRETADIAFQAALTGHMVFSTLHTNDAVSTINRLLDMKVERFKFAPGLTGVVSQRLVRRLCPECRVEEVPTPPLAELLTKWNLPVRLFKGKGCPKCSFTGLRGRTTIVELLDLSEQSAKDAVNSIVDGPQFRQEALRQGWLLPLDQDVLWHLANGEISLQEAVAFLGIAGSPDSPPVQPRSAQYEEAASGPKPRRILVVDDNLDNRVLIRDTLQSESCRISEADCGPAGLEQIEREKPDLLILDLMMPGMDGMAVLRRLRRDMKLLELPVLILTAMGEAESQALALETGADDFMTKPFNPRILRARVQALFRRRSETMG